MGVREGCAPARPQREEIGRVALLRDRKDKSFRGRLREMWDSSKNLFFSNDTIH